MLYKDAVALFQCAIWLHKLNDDFKEEILWQDIK